MLSGPVPLWHQTAKSQHFSSEWRLHLKSEFAVRRRHFRCPIKTGRCLLTVCVWIGFTAHVSSIRFILYKRERANVITGNPGLNVPSCPHAEATTVFCCVRLFFLFHLSSCSWGTRRSILLQHKNSPLKFSFVTKRPQTAGRARCRPALGRAGANKALARGHVRQ